MAYRIKNWEKFQHYKKRNQDSVFPWIKVYRGLLDDPEWNELSGDCVKGLLMLWLVASETNGVLPSNKRLAFRFRMPEQKVNTLLSKLSHWVYNDSSTTLAEGYSDASREEKRGEREEKEKERASDLLFETFWKAYPKRVAKSAAKKVWDRLRPTDELLRNMVHAVEKWKKSEQWRKDDGQFIPHPATWLNQRRWEDDPPAGINKAQNPIDRLFELGKGVSGTVQQGNEKRGLDDVSSLLGGVDKT